MNLTATERAEALAANVPFIVLCDEYKALCAVNDLPLSVDVPTLVTHIQSALFDKLLSIDKGLKARYEMLRSDTAKLKMIADNVDLTGYDIVDTLRAAVAALTSAYRRVWVGSALLHKNVTFEQFADVAELDLPALLDGYVLDWTGKAHVLACFQSLAPALEKLRDMFRAGISTHYTLADTLGTLARCYTPESSAGALVANEHAVMRLANDLDNAGKLAAFKK